MSTSAGPSISARLLVSQAGHVLDEQLHRAGLVHHHVVAAVRAAPVDVDVRDGGDAGPVLGDPQRRGQQQPVDPALLDQVAVVTGRPRVLGRLLHDHDDVAALAGPLQRAALQPDPDRVAQHRDDHGEGAGAALLQGPGQGIGPVALHPRGAQDPLVGLRPDRQRRIAVQHPRHRGHVHARGLGDVHQPRGAPRGTRGAAVPAELPPASRGRPGRPGRPVRSARAWSCAAAPSGAAGRPPSARPRTAARRVRR